MPANLPQPPLKELQGTQHANQFPDLLFSATRPWFLFWSLLHYFLYFLYPLFSMFEKFRIGHLLRHSLFYLKCLYFSLCFITASIMFVHFPDDLLGGFFQLF